MTDALAIKSGPTTLGDSALVIRPATQADGRFFASSWCDTYVSSALAHSLPPAVYDTRWRPLVQRALGRSSVCVLVTEDSPDVILGWLAREGPLLHYLYVREDFRRMGYARRLLQWAHEGERLTQYTSRTTDWQMLTNTKRVQADRLAFLRALVYDPTRLWRHLGDLG